MSKAHIEIGADGVDGAKIAGDIASAVERKSSEGVYSEPVGIHMPGINLEELKTNDKFLDAYIDRLREAVFVDINDFEIQERRSFMPGLLVRFKRSIWKLLKWYTYRLWSQQNQINGLLLSLNEAIDNRHATRIRELEERLAKIEQEKS